MQKNIIFISIAVALLSLIFIIISLLVIITRGNKPSFISKKLLIGGLILTLTAMFYACDSGNTKNTPNNINCYNISTNDSNSQNEIGNNASVNEENEANCNKQDYICLPAIHNSSDGSITVEMSVSNKLAGKIERRKSDKYSYCFRDIDNEIVSKDNIYPSDGKFNENFEDFEIEIDKNIASGDYIIFFYSVSLEDQTTENYTSSFPIKIFN